MDKYYYLSRGIWINIIINRERWTNTIIYPSCSVPAKIYGTPKIEKSTDSDSLRFDQ